MQGQLDVAMAKGIEGTRAASKPKRPAPAPPVAKPSPAPVVPVDEFRKIGIKGAKIMEVIKQE